VKLPVHHALLLVAVVLVAATPRLLEPGTWSVLQAMAALGPLSGWRCAHGPEYTYDPRHESADSALLADSPEAPVLAHVPWLEIDRVEVDLRGGDTLVSARAPMPDGTEAPRVYVLSPGKLQAITADLADGPGTLCNAHLGDWQIVGEQEAS
jgi:hypothetical protein